MKLIRQIFTGFVGLSFSLFLTSPLLALHGESQNTIVLSSNFSDTCTTNIQCEVLMDGQYICHTTGETISNQGSSIHHVPVGKSGTNIVSDFSFSLAQYKENIGEKLITYIGPDPYMYPFVGIIKIQV